MTSTEKNKSGCCGGPSAADEGACCVLDADEKKAGKDGCGCSSTLATKDGETQKKAGCCG